MMNKLLIMTLLLSSAVMAQEKEGDELVIASGESKTKHLCVYYRKKETIACTITFKLNIEELDILERPKKEKVSF